ncbi:hypothetical protein B0F90DRAFT_1622340 [Multifurca ochricompacta]|uniref:Uncharacterized protein n=1 Tax=Multifurca ochricompacta TaxID=376703 RepID=A0AAD4QPU3_9AGAM|nr:hypothetical protein B0F90DRAFT_1622340 [Multifurca ochricompacta]
MSSRPSSSLEHSNSIHVEIPPRFYLIPGGAMCIGTAIGLVRGSRAAGLRFLAENAHRPPTTVQGWYFYNKTKNYKMMLAGLSKAGTDAAKLGFTALAWVTFEEGFNQLGFGWNEIGEIGAGIGTAGVFAGVYQLPLRTASRAGLLGLLVGITMRTMRWGKERLAEEAQARKGEVNQ